jgi:hypothetical protein
MMGAGVARLSGTVSERRDKPQRPSDGPILKDVNRMQLWLIIAANVVIFFAAQHEQTILALDFKGLLASAANFAPVGIAVVITTLLNGLISADMKARLVFLRWTYALRGHRAFSKYALRDPRISADKLTQAISGNVPNDPPEQNALWYSFYKTYKNEPTVIHAHREFLLMRDYTALALLFLIVFGISAWLFFSTSQSALFYSIFLVAQLLLARQAASTYGVRFVTTVLAEKAAGVA